MSKLRPGAIKLLAQGHTAGAEWGFSDSACNSLTVGARGLPMAAQLWHKTQRCVLLAKSYQEPLRSEERELRKTCVDQEASSQIGLRQP